MVCGELVRAGDGWEFHAVARGFTGGLIALAAEFGIGARATPPSPSPSLPPAQPAAQQPPPPAPYGPAQPDPGFALPPQGPQFLPPER
jgi:hypothetical protein